MRLIKRKTFTEKRIDQLEKLMFKALRKSGREATRGYTSLSLSQLNLAGRIGRDIEELREADNE